MNKSYIYLMAMSICFLAQAMQQPATGSKRKRGQNSADVQRSREVGDRAWRDKVPTHLDPFERLERYDREFEALNSPLADQNGEFKTPPVAAEDAPLINFLYVHSASVPEDELAASPEKYVLARTIQNDMLVERLCALPVHQQQLILTSNKLAKTNGVIMQAYEHPDGVNRTMRLPDLRERLAGDIKELKIHCPDNEFLRTFFLNQLAKLGD